MRVSPPASTLPPTGSFVTTKPKVIERCVQAHRAAKHGGFVNLKGFPVVIRKIEFEQEPGADLRATVHYERVRDLRASRPLEMVRRH